MAHEDALMIVNTLQRQLSTLARGIVRALEDNKVSGPEWSMLGMQGANLAMFCITNFQGMTPELRKDILYVLEHGEWAVQE